MSFVFLRTTSATYTEWYKYEDKSKVLLFSGDSTNPWVVAPLVTPVMNNNFPKESIKKMFTCKIKHAAVGVIWSIFTNNPATSVGSRGNILKANVRHTQFSLNILIYFTWENVNNQVFHLLCGASRSLRDQRSYPPSPKPHPSGVCWNQWPAGLPSCLDGHSAATCMWSVHHLAQICM